MYRISRCKKSIHYTLLRNIKGNKERRKVIHRIKGKNEAGQEQTMENINQLAVRWGGGEWSVKFKGGLSKGF
jgi:hypothetical protein